jgi:hypothetical protein
LKTIPGVNVGNGVSVAVGVLVGRGVPVGNGEFVEDAVEVGGNSIGVFVVAWKSVGEVVALSKAVGMYRGSMGLTFIARPKEHPTINTDNPTIQFT